MATQAKRASEISASELAGMKVRLAQAAQSQADRRTHLRRVLDELKPEILQLREAGFSWPGVADQLARQGLGVSEVTLRQYVDGTKPGSSGRRRSAPAP